MSQRLLLSLTLWASCSPGNAGTVKPDPPPRSRAPAHSGTAAADALASPCLLAFPGSPLSSISSLKYRVGYRCHGASHFCQVGPIEATTFTLRAAQPRAKYFVQVSAQDLMDYGKPSDWSLPGQAARMPQNPWRGTGSLIADSDVIYFKVTGFGWPGFESRLNLLGWLASIDLNFQTCGDGIFPSIHAEL